MEIGMRTKVSNNSLSMPAPTSFYSRLKDFLSKKPWLFRIARTARFAALVGPWRAFLVGFYRTFNWNPRVDAIGPTMVPDLNESEIVSTLERNGFAVCGMLPEDCIDRLVEKCGPMQRATFDNFHDRWDEIGKIAYDTKFVEIARRYLGVEPIVNSSCIRWSIPGVKDQDGMTANGHLETFHFDVADCRSLVVYVYLTDVLDEQCGPHMAIEGTHKKKNISDLINVYLDDDSALQTFGDRIKTVLGKKGTIIFEEQTIYHKRAIAEKPRLMLAITYTLQRKPVR
jgi:hypothetical protein